MGKDRGQRFRGLRASELQDLRGTELRGQRQISDCGFKIKEAGDRSQKAEDGGQLGTEDKRKEV